MLQPIDEQRNRKDECEPADMPDLAALPAAELRSRLYHIASEAKLISLAARAINEDDGASGAVASIFLVDHDQWWCARQCRRRVRVLSKNGKQRKEKGEC